MLSSTPTPLSFYQGESLTLELLVRDETGAAFDLTGAAIYFTVKSSVKDETPLIQKTTADILEIEITNALAGTAEIFLQPVDTASLGCRGYFYDVWVVSAGKRYVVIPPSQLTVQSPVLRLPL